MFMRSRSARPRARQRLALLAVGSAASFALAGCGGEAGSAEGGDGSQLIIYHVGFACGLNDYTNQLCQGITEKAKKLGPAYEVEIKTGVDYLDSVALNNAIQTNLQRNPAGLLIFASGPDSNVLTLKKACDQGVKIITIDVRTEGLGDCLSSHIGANNPELGEAVGEWLNDHQPASKEVGVVNFPPGQQPVSDERVEGFEKAVTAAGFEVVARESTQLSLDDTRTKVTNMVTAHPNIGAIFAANSIIASGVRQALQGHPDVKLLTVDGVLSDIPFILDGSIDAEAAQAPYVEGELAVEYMVKLLSGESVPKLTYTPTQVVDKSNAAEYEAAGGMR